ncbi:MAG TPA: protoporphyrinogen oxidase [Kofleriaceae bacterium]|nr:protoporphyrinogen oxidase [Kofleriaceae bacterium]
MNVAVIGGGLAGLVAARALVRAGVDARVFEAAERPGGVVGTTAIGGYVREHAAGWFVGGPPDGALALCRELGVAVDRASRRARRRWIYLDGKLRALPRSPQGLVTTDLLTWRGKLDLLREPLRPAGHVADESVHAFAARRFGAEAARAIFSPLVTAIYAADAHDISLAAGFPRLAALDARGGIVRGLLVQAVRGTAARLRGARPATTPRGLWAPRGGMQAMIDALAGELGPRLRRRAPVARIEPADGGVRVDGARWDGAVLAIPAEDAVGLIGAPACGDLAHRLAAFHRAPAAQVYLGFPASAVPHARDGAGVLVAQGEDVRALGVAFDSTLWPDRAPAGHALVRCMFGGGRDPQITRLDDAALIAQATRDLGVALGVTAQPSHASVVRCPRGVAQYGLGHGDRVRDAVAVARSQRIVLAGADYRGPGLDALCADAATIVAEVTAW